MPPQDPGRALPNTAYAGSDPSPRAEGGAPLSPTSSSIGFVAVVVCISAFLLGLIPVVGFLLGIAGIALVVISARTVGATRMSIAGGVMAGLAALASVTTTVALVIVLALPGGPASTDPVAGPSAPEDEAGQVETPEQDGQDGDPVEDSPEPEPTAEETTEAQEETVPSTEPASEETSEAQEDPAPSTEPSADGSDHEEVDERTLAQIVKVPDDHVGRQVIVYGQITQLDAATGPCVMRVSVAHAPQGEWYEYEHNTIGFGGDGVSECPVLDPFVTEDEVKLWVTIGGSASYDTQIGGSTTAPTYLVDKAELLEG